MSCYKLHLFHCLLTLQGQFFPIHAILVTPDKAKNSLNYLSNAQIDVITTYLNLFPDNSTTCWFIIYRIFRDFLIP